MMRVLEYEMKCYSNLIQKCIAVSGAGLERERGEREKRPK